jgi:Mg-chelatase subunit ChlD
VVLILMTILFMCLVGILAMAVDIGYLYNVKSDLQTAVDAAALAGASGLCVDQDTARARAVDLALKNFADGHTVSLAEEDIELGYWSSSGFEIVESPAARPNAIKVTARLNKDRDTEVAYFLAGMLGFDSANVTASAIAVFGAREIVLSIDLSASMSYDSQLRHFQLLGRPVVEQMLSTAWRDLRLDPESPLHHLDGTQMTRESIRINSTNYAGLINTLGLGGVPYPFPPCTWRDYFDYVQQNTSNSRNDGKCVPDFYRNRYGYITLMDYLQAVQYRYGRDHVPLWKTEQQPVTAVKDAIAVFLAYMNTMRTDDRIGLVSYCLDDFNAKLETHLTDDYELVESMMRQKQAGHYHNETNLAAGIREALDELLRNGRNGTSRLIVLLSDGKARRPYNETYGRAAALQQADRSAESFIPILTISLGVDADTVLMQEIADRTKGAHFIIPGGHSVYEYEQQLNEVFLQIAKDRPLSLVD